MKIKEILKIERENTESIFLHKEGLFWRAYEHSAYLFTLYIKEYKITKKFYKNVNAEVVYLGFPANALQSLLQFSKEKDINKEETQIIIGKYEFTNNDFLKWKAGTQLWQSSETLPKFEQSDIIEKIKNFPVVGKTPIECQQFLIELQSEL